MLTPPKLAEKRSTRSSLKLRRSSDSNKSVEKRISFRRAQEESSSDIARGVLNEIVGVSLEKIHERYLEAQTIKFVVHCAHQALMKALRMQFYQHNAYTRDTEHWGSDECLPPSNPDSWAAHQVPISKSISASEQELNTLSLIKLDMERKSGTVVYTELDDVSQQSDTLIDDIKALVDEMIDNLPFIDVEKSEKSDSAVSAFTMVVEGIQHFEDFTMTPQLSRISAAEPSLFKLPKIDLPESGNSRRYQSLTELSQEMEKLPPIRTDANYKCRPPPVPDDKSKKNKGKKN